MELDIKDYRNFIASQIQTFSDYLIKNDYQPDDLDLENIENSTLNVQVFRFFAEYIQNCHKKLEWQSLVIEEMKEKMYYELLAVSNISIISKYRTKEIKISKIDLFSLQVLDLCNDINGEINTKVNNKNGQLKPNYGYLVFLEFKKYLLHQSENIIISDKENTELDLKQKQKIGLLFRSGIIDFLKKENPDISINQIAGFIALLTKEQLKKTTINPYLSKENSKYAIQNEQDKNDLDLILNQYGITPKSE